MSAARETAKVPTYWLAVDDDGQVVFGLHTNDANGGEVSRSLVNSYINDRWLNGYKLHLFGALVHQPLLASVVAVDSDVATDRIDVPIEDFGNRVAKLLREIHDDATHYALASHDVGDAVRARLPLISQLIDQAEATQEAKLRTSSSLPAALTFNHFRQANVARCLKWHPAGIESWSPSDWLTALAGELGELASLLKMRNRERDGLPGNKFSPTDKMVADELADVLTYLDLLAAALGVDLSSATVAKFNEVSERVGFPDRLALGGDGT